MQPYHTNPSLSCSHCISAIKSFISTTQCPSEHVHSMFSQAPQPLHPPHVQPDTLLPDQHVCVSIWYVCQEATQTTTALICILQVLQGHQKLARGGMAIGLDNEGCTSIKSVYARSMEKLGPIWTHEQYQEPCLPLKE